MSTRRPSTLGLSTPANPKLAGNCEAAPEGQLSVSVVGWTPGGGVGVALGATTSTADECACAPMYLSWPNHRAVTVQRPPWSAAGVTASEKLPSAPATTSRMKGAPLEGV